MVNEIFILCSFNKKNAQPGFEARLMVIYFADSAR